MKFLDFLANLDEKFNIPTGVAGIMYIGLSILHFGRFFFDLDKLITNVTIGILIITISWLIQQNVNKSRDIQAIDRKANDNEYKLTKV